MKIIVCTPSYGAPDHDHLLAVSRLVSAAREAGHKIEVRRVYNLALLCQARSELATGALFEGADVVFFIDADIMFEAGQALGMCELVWDKGLDLLGAAVTTRQQPGRLCCEFQATRVKLGTEGGLYEVSAVGMALTVVHKHLLERMAKMPQCGLVMGLQQKQIHPFFQCLFAEGAGGVTTWSGEDYGFCCLARETGAKLFVDTRVRTLHKGIHGFGWEHMLSTLKPVDSFELDFTRK